jgi:hypothetical protein
MLRRADLLVVGPLSAELLGSSSLHPAGSLQKKNGPPIIS